MAKAGTSTPLTPDECRWVLESKILGGEWPPGRKLPSERSLAEQFGVSRPVIREVLKTLQAQMLVDVQPGRGSFVRQLEPGSGRGSMEQMLRMGSITTRDLISARKVLESEAAALAAVNRTDEQLESLGATLDAFEGAGSTHEAVGLDVAFHQGIVEASGNAVILIMFGSIKPLVQAMVLRSLTDRRSRRSGAPIHHEILRAIANKNANAARKAVSSHITLAEEYYGRDLDIPLADVLNQRAVANREHAALLRDVSESIKSL